MAGALHCHSDYSDGTKNIFELVNEARQEGLSFISITDHNTLKSAWDAASLGSLYGIELIPGLEVTTVGESCECYIHILAYYPKTLTCSGLERIVRTATPDACKMLRRRGCVVGMAHVESSRAWKDCEALARAGLLDFLEVAHPTFSDEGAKRAVELAERYNLIKTCGCDYHGDQLAYHSRKISDFSDNDVALREIKLISEFREGEK